jgi:hypothetical protein
MSLSALTLQLGAVLQRPRSATLETRLLLEQLSTVRLPASDVTNATLDSLVVHLADLLQWPAVAATVAALCANLLLKQRPLPLGVSALNALVPPLLSLAVSAPRESPAQLDAFRALAALVLERGALVTARLQSAVVVSLLAAADDAKRPSPETLRMSMNTLGNLCVGAGAAIAPPLYASLTSALATHLDAAVRAFFAGKRTATRSLCAVLRAWTLVLPECGRVFERYFSGLCVRLRDLVFLRPSSSTLLPAAPSVAADDGADGAADGAAEFAGVPVHRGTSGPSPVSAVLQVAAPTVPQSVSSESESSSSAEADVRKRAVKVQLAALTCLQQLARVSPHAFFGVVLARAMPALPTLESLTPLIAAMATRHSTLLTLAACADTPQAVAAGCVATVSLCLEGSRQLLQTLAPTAANERQQRNAAFTPLANVALQTVAQIHDELVAALCVAAPPTGRMLTSLLQCCSLLVLNTPYAQLDAARALALRVPMARCAVDVLRRLLACADAPAAEVAVALALFGACLAVSPPQLDVTRLVFEPADDALFARVLAFSAGAACDVDASVAAESLSALSACAAQYVAAVIPFWTRVQALCRRRITDANSVDNVVLAGLRTLETLAHALSCHAQATSSETVEPLRTAHARFIVQTIADDTLALRSANVRAALCNCLTAIGPSGFGALERFEQVHCLSVLLGASSDAGVAVRAAALRALGVFVLFPDLRSDTAFVLDVTHALIQAMKDDQLSVRMRAAWSIANVCDTLVSTATMSIDSAFGAATKTPPIDGLTFADDDEAGNEQMTTFRDGDEHDSLLADLPQQTLVQLARTALAASTDHERVRPNAVRALGHFARFAPLDVLFLVESGGAEPLIAVVISALVARLGSGSAKVRWNASYALGSALRNVALRRHLLATPALADAPWFAPRLFGALIAACTTSANFKVRINSALAISAGPHRVLYGSALFGSTLAALSTLLFRRSGEEPSDAGTAVHARRWHEQLERTLLHLLALADAAHDAPLSVWQEFKSDFVALLDRTLNELSMAQRRRELRARKAGASGDAGASKDELDAIELVRRAVHGLAECAASLLTDDDRARMLVEFSAKEEDQQQR